MSEMLLELDNFSLSFQRNDLVIPAVSNISFSVKKGEVLAIVGESGSGKSVTSLAILNLLGYGASKVIQNGEIRFLNQSLNTVHKADFQKIRGDKISMIFQEPMTSLNPLKTCGEQVIEVVKQHKKTPSRIAKTKVLDLFEKVKLPHVNRVFSAYPHEISGGQKQRVMIAMALICEPELLIADEPTTALDVTVQKEVLSLLKDLQTELNMGVIFISHDLSVVSQIADNVLVMFRGNALEFGAVNDVLNNPKHAYTKSLLACRPPVNKTLIRLPVVSDFLTVNDEIITPKNVDFEKFIDTLVVSKEHTLKNTRYAQPPILEVKNISKHYLINNSFFKRGGVFKAVDAVSFNVYKGETLGLVGESGCGKTTLSRMLLKLIPASSGSVEYNGTNLLSLSAKELRVFRKKIQIIFQDPYSSLNPKHTIGQALLEPMKVHGIGKNSTDRKEKAISLLEKVGLDATVFHRYPHEFSGGQRQRIVIARALCLEPEFIICDESVSALDISVQAQVLNLLNDLKKELNLTYIFISHDLAVVKYMSDRLLVMNQGKIEEQGASEDVFTHPKSDYTKRLISSIL